MTYRVRFCLLLCFVEICISFCFFSCKMCQIWKKVILLLYQCPTNFWVINVQTNDGNSDLHGWFNKEVHLPSISEIFFCDSFSIIFWSHWILATSATFSASEKINWCILFHRINRFSQIYLYVENVHSKHPSFAVLIFKNVVLSSHILLDRLTKIVALNSLMIFWFGLQKVSHYTELDSDLHHNCQVQEWDSNQYLNWNLHLWT